MHMSNGFETVILIYPFIYFTSLSFIGKNLKYLNTFEICKIRKKKFACDRINI